VTVRRCPRQQKIFKKTFFVFIYKISFPFVANLPRFSLHPKNGAANLGANRHLQGGHYNVKIINKAERRPETDYAGPNQDPAWTT
jgi:hypothetical protein